VAEKTPEAEEVQVRRTELQIPRPGAEPETVVYITYMTKDLPPGLVTISKAEWTLEEEIKRIRADIDGRRKVKPSVIRI